MKIIATVITFALAFCAGCTKVREQVSPQIADIISNPRNFDGKEVQITGVVTDAFSFYRAGYFRLSDGTGSIAVVTTQISPRQGEQVEARGVVEQAYTIGSDQMLVIVEKSARAGTSVISK